MGKTTVEQINDQIRRYFQDCLNRNEEIAAIYPSDPTFDIYAETEGLTRTIEGYREQLRSRVYTPEVQEAATELIAGIPLSASVSRLDALHHACRGLLRAKIDSALHLAAELTGEQAVPRDPLFATITASDLPLPFGEVAPPPAPDAVPPQHAGPDVPEGVEQIALQELVTRFQTAKHKGKWTGKTASDLTYTMQIVYGVIRPATLIGAISDKDMRALRDLITNLPPNAQKSKQAEGQSLTALADANVGGETLSYATQEKRLRFFKTMLGWAVDEGYLTKVPGAKVKIEKPDRDEEDDRDPYSPEQLRQIFRSPVYTGRRSEAHSNSPGNLLLRDGKFWVPLIGLYSGMRLGEIVQLLKSDIKQENGVWFFDNRRNPGEVKRFKTSSSIRRVPVHRQLIAAGFLEHVNRVPEKSRLFPELKLGMDGYFSANFSKWWTRYAKDCGFYARRTAFHSFRHNFVDAMRAVEAPQYAIEAVVGHKNKSINGKYGSGVKLTHMQELVNQIAYDLPELDALRIPSVTQE
jgi:integrase